MLRLGEERPGCCRSSPTRSARWSAPRASPPRSAPSSQQLNHREVAPGAPIISPAAGGQLARFRRGDLRDWQRHGVVVHPPLCRTDRHRRPPDSGAAPGEFGARLPPDRRRHSASCRDPGAKRSPRLSGNSIKKSRPADQCHRRPPLAWDHRAVPRDGRQAWPDRIRGTFWQTIGSRKIVPPMRLRSVPFGEGYIRFRWNSSMRPRSGVTPAHLTPTPYCLIASAAATAILSSVCCPGRLHLTRVRERQAPRSASHSAASPPMS